MKPDPKEIADLKSKIADLTKENAKLTHDATEGFNKLIATIGERDAKIRALELQGTILRSEMEANLARFVEIENDRDVQKHLATEKEKVIAKVTQEFRVARETGEEAVDERATLMAALKRVVRG